MGNVVLWDAVRPHLCLRKTATMKRLNVRGDGGHPDGPHAHLLVSLHQLLQAGQGPHTAPRHRRERQLRLPRLPPLHRALLLTGLVEGGLEGEDVAVAEARGREAGGGRGEAAGEGLLRVGGRAAAARL